MTQFIPHHFKTLGVSPFKLFSNFQKGRSFTCKQKVVFLLLIKALNSSGLSTWFFFFLYFKSFYSVLSKSVQIRVNHVVEMVINKETTLWGLEFMATGIIIIVEIQPMTYYYYNFQ